MLSLTRRSAGTAEPESRTSPGRHTALSAAGIVFFLLAAFGGGWFAAGSFQSPAQRAAAAKAPPPGAVTAEVGRGALEHTISANAVVSRQTQQQVAVAGAVSPSVVTNQTRASGAPITAGIVALEVNGRPRFSMPGKFPFYRDLHPGDSGPDVVQLQLGLQAAGYAVPSDGKFGKRTEAATRGLYKTSGYAVSTASTTNTTESAPSGAAGSAPAQAAPESADQGTGNGTGSSSGSGATGETTLSVPSTEILVFASLPAYLVAAPAVGTILDAKSMITIEAGSEIAVAAVASSIAVTLRAGMTATLSGPDGSTIPVTVGTIGTPAAQGLNSGSADGDSAASRGASTPDGGVTADDTSPGASISGAGGDVTVVLVAGSKPLPASWLRSVTLAVITVEVAAKDSLLVPTIAVITGGKRPAHVLKRLRDGSFSKIEVDEVAQLGGQSAV